MPPAPTSERRISRVSGSMGEGSKPMGRKKLRASAEAASTTMPRPWTLRQTANRASTTTGMGSGLLRLVGQGTLLEPAVEAGVAAAKACRAVMLRQRLRRQLIHQRYQGLGAVMVRRRRSVGLGGASSWRRNWSKCSGETACQACCTSSSRAAVRAACRTKSVRVRPEDRTA
ncbi:protein of unknown function [Cyanobium sp. NIES-981]|nr:protein of unknown function [Cyanobium sp. NIES-981]